MEEIAASFNPVFRGWINYFGTYYRSMLAPILGPLDYALVRWARKYKRLKGSPTKVREWVKLLRRNLRKFFAVRFVMRPRLIPIRTVLRIS